MRAGALRLLVVVAILLSAAGCLQPAASNPPPSDNPAPTPGPPASLIILMPEDGQAFNVIAGTSATDIQISLVTTDFTVRPPGPRNQAGEGHFTIQLDEEEPAQIYTKQYALRNVAPGQHTLRVELVQNDNSPHAPPIRQIIRFVVIEPKYEPSVYIVNIMDAGYLPADLQVKAGDSVVWTNVGEAPRTVTSTGNFNSGTLTSGQNFSVTFDRVGEYDYFSVNNPGMRGRVTVAK